MVRLVVAIVMVLALVTGVVAVGCGSDKAPVDTTGTTVIDTSVLTVEQALAAEPGSMVRVRGTLVATDSGSGFEMVLASALLESFPPQAGGAKVVLEGLKLEDLVGLTSSAEQPGHTSGMPAVVWSDFWLVLEGTISDGVLQVEGMPQVASATFQGAAVRFSPVSEPYASGETAWWAFEVANVGAEPLLLTFGSGQDAEVVLAQGGVEKYRWSDEKAFTEAIEEVTLQPGEVWSAVLNDPLPVAPGRYDVTAYVTATAGPLGGGGSERLPELTVSVEVR